MAQWGRIATCCERIELLGVGAVGTLDGAVELGGSPGQHEPVQTALPAGRPARTRPRTPIRPRPAGRKGKRQARLQGIEERNRGGGGGAGVGLNYVPAPRPRGGQGTV